MIALAVGEYFFMSRESAKFIANNAAGAVFAAAGDASTSAPSITSGAVQQPPNTKLYQSSVYHFSLYYPNNLSVSEHPGAGGTMVVLFQDKASQQGFEIFIAPYSDSKITQQRFEEDEPSGVMQSPQNITIAGAAATDFVSSNAAMGASREIWFLHGGYLYEVTTPQPLSDWLISIMQTWQFI